jgi:hypothetical protein
MRINQNDVCNKDFNYPFHDDELASLCKNHSNSLEICVRFWVIDRRLIKEQSR